MAKRRNEISNIKRPRYMNKVYVIGFCGSGSKINKYSFTGDVLHLPQHNHFCLFVSSSATFLGYLLLTNNSSIYNPI